MRYGAGGSASRAESDTPRSGRPKPERPSRGILSAQIVGGEGVALPRIAGPVAGAEPLPALVGRPVRERVLVHRSVAEIALDEVVTDPARRVERAVDVVLV